MFSRINLVKAACAAAVVVFCLGYAWKIDDNAQSNPGYIEFKVNFAVRDGDVYSYGDSILTPNAEGKLNSVYLEPAGKDSIYLRRNNEKHKICTAPVRQDRVVSVVLKENQGGIFCEVKP